MLIFLLLESVSSDCVITNECPGSIFNCKTPQRIDPKPAFPIDYPDISCPMFSGSNVCCNHDQSRLMNFRFKLLEETLGNIAGGCDVCVANMKKMWCHYGCSPDQDKFVFPGEQEMIPNPALPEEKIKVLLVNFTVTSEFSCSLFESCKKCPRIDVASSTMSPQGFLETQGYKGSAVSKMWVTFLFPDHGFSTELASCDYQGDNLYGFDVKPCSCSNCESSCKGDFYAEELNATYGIRWVPIVITYGVVACVTLLIIVIKYFYKKRQQRILSN